jgi:hypothetical protein
LFTLTDQICLLCLSNYTFVYTFFLLYFTDVAGKLAQLENAFKKYQVTEAECEMYIACEASQVNRHEANGPLAKQVYDILR